MKRVILLLTSLICLALSSASLHAALRYWDTNGITAGTGDMPNGSWNSSFWSLDSGGTTATGPWVSGDTAVFSAGSDGTNAFTVTVDMGVQASGITFEEGQATLSGEEPITMTGQFEFPIIAMTNASIFSQLWDTAGGSGTCGIKKTGPGRVALDANNLYGGTNIVAEGVLAVSRGGADTPLGSPSAPTIVSDGATLEHATSASSAEPVILSGNGFNNLGALRGTSGSPLWTGGAVLTSDTRINWDGGGEWLWRTARIIGTNNGGNFNLTIGGNGGSIRLDIFYPSINIGTGVIIKDGTSTIRFEQPNYCSAFYFNGGNVVVRNQAEYGAWGSAIYIGAGAGEFRTGDVVGPSFTLTTPIVLSAGANPRFSPSSGFGITNNGQISGPGGLSAANGGWVVLRGAKTYSGNTTILGGTTPGTLVLGANGSIANSLVIDVKSGATFDVSAVTGGYVLGAAQTLKGSGTVAGNVTANGTLAPEAAATAGNLVFNANLALGVDARLFIKVDRDGFPTSDMITVLGGLSAAGAGAVQVTNVGGALLAGDSFQLLSQPLVNGQALAVFGGGVVWTNKLWVDGTIAVVSVSPVSPPNVKVTATSLNSVTLGATGGGAYQGYGVFASTNVATPMANWWLIGGATANGSGVISFTDTQALQQTKFYRFGQ